MDQASSVLLFTATSPGFTSEQQLVMSAHRLSSQQVSTCPNMNRIVDQRWSHWRVASKPQTVPRGSSGSRLRPTSRVDSADNLA